MFGNIIPAVLILLIIPSLAVSKPLNIMQAKKYSAELSVENYFVSEKLDGVRARWDGENLVSRGGNIFAAPKWFVKNFPQQALDGELWLGRGAYQKTVSVVMRRKPHQGWEGIRFMVFDLPNSKESFEYRTTMISQLVAGKSQYLSRVTQLRLDNNKQLMKLLDKVLAKGGEGLMLHHQDAFYKAGRSMHLLKLKKFDDAEAVVIGYKPGKGKYAGLTGSLKLRAPDGREFYVGSGLSDKLRTTPPAIGAVVTYRYQGFTNSGLPRFPVYLRQRLIK